MSSLCYILLLFECAIECESLIRKMLVIDMSKRIQLDKVRSHPWMLMHDTAYDYSILRHVPANPARVQCYTRPIPGVGGGESQFVWNDQVLECMNRMGYTPEKVREVSRVLHTTVVSVFCLFLPGKRVKTDKICS